MQLRVASGNASHVFAEASVVIRIAEIVLTLDRLGAWLHGHDSTVWRRASWVVPSDSWRGRIGRTSSRIVIRPGAFVSTESRTAIERAGRLSPIVRIAMKLGRLASKLQPAVTMIPGRAVRSGGGVVRIEQDLAPVAGPASWLVPIASLCDDAGSTKAFLQSKVGKAATWLRRIGAPIARADVLCVVVASRVARRGEAGEGAGSGGVEGVEQRVAIVVTVIGIVITVVGIVVTIDRSVVTIVRAVARIVGGEVWHPRLVNSDDGFVSRDVRDAMRSP